MLPADAPYRQYFCNAACEEAGKKIACDACGPAGEVALRAGCRVCTTCGKGSPIAETVAAVAWGVGQAEQTKLGNRFKRNAEMLPTKSVGMCRPSGPTAR